MQRIKPLATGICVFGTLQRNSNINLFSALKINTKAANIFFFKFFKSLEYLILHMYNMSP